MANQDRCYSSETQIFWCAKTLFYGRNISGKMENCEVNGWQRAAILHALSRKYVRPILADHRGPENTAYYRLTPGIDTTKLKCPASAKLFANGVPK